MTVEPRQAFYPIGIWYGVETVPAGERDDLARRLDADLATIRRMRLNTVFFRHLAPEAYAPSATAARRQQLKMVLPDRAAQYYVMTGRPETPPAPASWVTGQGRNQAVGATWAVDLGYAVDRESAERLERVAARYRSDPALPATFAQTAGPMPESVTFAAAIPHPVRLPEEAAGTGWGTQAKTAPLRSRLGSFRGMPKSATGELGQATPARGRAMLTLVCDHRPGESPSEAVRRWWWNFHAGLAGGLTGGMVIDQFHGIPGRGSALADPDGAVDLERINAVKRMAERMQRWGMLLNPLEVKPFLTPPGVGEALSITLFARDQRRLLLVFNRSPTEYSRTTLALGEVIDGSPAGRLVEVPGDSEVALGAVTEARRGGMTLTLDLAPGDAKLYEVFH